MSRVASFSMQSSWEWGSASVLRDVADETYRVAVVLHAEAVGNLRRYRRLRAELRLNAGLGRKCDKAAHVWTKYLDERLHKLSHEERKAGMVQARRIGRRLAGWRAATSRLSTHRSSDSSQSCRRAAHRREKTALGVTACGRCCGAGKAIYGRLAPRDEQ